MHIDDPETLLKIHKIVVVGALGIRFDNLGPEHDSVGQLPGFATIDYYSDGSKKVCRSMCRQILPPTEKLFDQVDDALLAAGYRYGISHPSARNKYALVGCLGLGLKLVMSNPALNPTRDQSKKIDLLMTKARKLRDEQIQLFSRRNDIIYKLIRTQAKESS